MLLYGPSFSFSFPLIIFCFYIFALAEKALFGEHEWYFFSPRDRKYPNGARPNRATSMGFWKATVTDKPILTSSGSRRIGVKKALVFYMGSPSNGVKTDWIMNEYRLPDMMIRPARLKGSMRVSGCMALIFLASQFLCFLIARAIFISCKKLPNFKPNSLTQHNPLLLFSVKTFHRSKSSIDRVKFFYISYQLHPGCMCKITLLFWKCSRFHAFSFFSDVWFVIFHKIIFYDKTWFNVIFLFFT